MSSRTQCLLNVKKQSAKQSKEGDDLSFRLFLYFFNNCFIHFPVCFILLLKCIIHTCKWAMLYDGTSFKYKKKPKTRRKEYKEGFIILLYIALCVACIKCMFCKGNLKWEKKKKFVNIEKINVQYIRVVFFSYKCWFLFGT